MELRRAIQRDSATGVAVSVVPGGGGGAPQPGTTPAVHALTGDRHSASGLTVGHVLQALTATTFGFAAMLWSKISGIPAIIAELGGLADDAGWLENDGSGNLSWSVPDAADVGAEPDLGLPVADDYVLSSKADGTRSWVEPGGTGAGSWQRLSPSVSFSLTSYSAGAYKLSTPIALGGGHAIHIVCALNRPAVTDAICVAVSSDDFATYIAFSFNADGQRVNYGYYSGSLHVISNNGGTLVAGVHVFDIWLYINSVANGGFGAFWFVKSRGDPSPFSTAIPALTSYTTVALDGANFNIAIWAKNGTTDLRALDVEIM